MNRRNFIKGGLAAALLASIPGQIIADQLFFNAEDLISQRPPVDKRTFTSETVEKLLKEVKEKISDPELAWMFENCYPNTLDTTVDYEVIDGKDDTFIITGDIDAMWLRDSTAQVWPYMPLLNKEEKLKKMVRGLVNRQVKCVLLDPYANAFYKDMSRESHWKSDIPSPIAGVHERKWEIDSLCYVVRLSHGYYEITGDRSIFDEQWQQAMQVIYKTFRTEQRFDGESPYRFARRTTAMIDAPTFNGTGRPAKPNGLICSMFRPSDDATLFPYLIPSNIFAMLSLQQLAKIYKDLELDAEFAQLCHSFAKELDKSITESAIMEHLDFGKIFAYETDGFGNRLYMDDANVPSLMSLSYLDPAYAKSEIYQNTRKFLLSEYNPYFLKGEMAEGQASPHTGKDKIWPMGIILRAMTSSDNNEIIQCLTMLRATHADTGFMHEAFHKNNPKDFNRTWFAWANTLFGELIIKIANERPELLKHTFGE